VYLHPIRTRIGACFLWLQIRGLLNYGQRFPHFGPPLRVSTRLQLGIVATMEWVRLKLLNTSQPCNSEMPEVSVRRVVIRIRAVLRSYRWRSRVAAVHCDWRESNAFRCHSLDERRLLEVQLFLVLEFRSFLLTARIPSSSSFS
jgi:hypothetical protein